MAILTSGASQLKSSHWYDHEGNPVHRLPKASGEGDRATTIKDAARLHLLPSVTNILGTLDKPGLMQWKVNQCLQAADENPRQKDEPVEYWTKRIQDLAYKQVEVAADLGTRIHHALESCFDGSPIEPEILQYVQPVLDWLKQTGISISDREKRIVNLMEGYAGTSDVFFTFGKTGIGILDYKTKKTKVGEKVDSYLEHKAQLSAYAAVQYGTDRLDEVLAANLFISSTEPGRIEIVKCTSVRAHYETFLALCQVWRAVKGYDPRVRA